MLILLGLGLVAGLLGGLLGIGGGALIVPGLVFFLAFDQHKAHGTSLGAALMMSLASVIVYSRHGFIDIKLALFISAGGVVGAIVGARIAQLLGASVLRRVFCLFLIFVGVRMILNGLGPECDGAGTAATAAASAAGLRWGLCTFGLGVATGLLSALLGIGGGMVMVPGMVILLQVQQQMAQGVSLAAMIPTALTGSIMHHTMGNVDLRVAMWVGVGAVCGGVAGASVAGAIDPCILKTIFGGFMVLMSVLIVLKQNGRD